MQISVTQCNIYHRVTYWMHSFPMQVFKSDTMWFNQKFNHLDFTENIKALPQCQTVCFLLFNICILVLPSPVAIYDEHWKERNSFVGPYHEKDTINLVCQAVGGKSKIRKCNYFIFLVLQVHHPQV